MNSKQRPFFSVCIPAYNRKEYLPDLLDSILNQDFFDFEVVITEDFSPQREEIAKIVQGYQIRFPEKIYLYLNEQNLGYDGNLRRLIEKSSGHYCFFMGNDDLMASGALSKVFSGISKYSNVGAVLRTYASFDKTPENINQVFRYFPKDKFFSAGQTSSVVFYRRMVVIPGVVLYRDRCNELATNKYDGTLLYQLYLVGKLLFEMNGIFLSDVTVYYRNGGRPDFGASQTEKEKYIPGLQTPESSLLFVKDLLRIAYEISLEKNPDFYRQIEADFAAYSYPLLSIQANRGKRVFFSYYKEISKLGFSKYLIFHLYFLSLFILGAARVDTIIRKIKVLFGYTPHLGRATRDR